ncbi:MAG TPA: RsmE family RNA methyltransferase [Pirellulaceae bacterium]|nr:RsmE family RNA methyltransferase [Pirellulaceae bacterium]
MSERFFVESPTVGERALLEGDEARHLSRVMRAAVGDEVLLFDGNGAEFLARISAIRKSAIELAIVERRPIDRELPFNMTLAVALPKGERQKWLVEKATELGVTRLVPLITERGVAQPVESALARLRRAVVEASKQCGRNRLMEIGEPAALIVQSPKSKAQSQETVALSPGSCPLAPGSLRLIADPSGKPLGTIERGTGDVIAAVGPEGGFTPGELAAAVECGWQPVSLGKSILRVETAALAIAAWAALR